MIGVSLDQAGQTAGDLAALARLTRDVPRFLRCPMSLEQAKTRVRQQLETREHRFLQLVERSIYGHRHSPYLKLLRQTGCELGDLRALVAREGVEGALEQLAARGVYVTFDEFKGRRPAVRGSQRFAFHQRDFDNPLVAPHFSVYTGGTGGRPSRVGRSLASIGEMAELTALGLDAHGLAAPRVAFWATSPISWLLYFAKLGCPLVGWFYPLRPLPPRVWFGGRYLALLARLVGRWLPLPDFLDLQDPARLAAWLARQQQHGQPLVVCAVVSSAVRVALAAQAAGIDLAGVTFMVQSEPVTAARRRAIEAAGCRVIVDYGSMEMTLIAYGCANPAAPDDVHLFHHRHALIQRPRSVTDEGLEVEAFMFSSLSPSAPKVCLNTELGDYGRVEQRECGCGLGQVGFRTHLSDIRSFEKLSGEGVTFARTSLMHVLEAVLPARFGGTSMDYQLVEEEGVQSATRLVLRVSPSVGALDDAAVRSALLEELGRGGPADQDSAGLLRRAEAVSIVRLPPLATPAGKILPFQLVRTTSGLARQE